MSFDPQEYQDRLIPWSDIQGHMPFLADTVAGYEQPVVIELGVRSGQSTSALLAGLAGAGELWSVDIDPAQVPAHWHDLPEWRFLQADDVSEQAQQWLPAACDVLFIDTSHETRHTLTELRLYVPRVKAGGVVLLHDTEWAPPSTMLPGPGGMVTDALNAYAAETGLSWSNRTGFLRDGRDPAR